jgi:large subunit ribosomal protein L2
MGLKSFKPITPGRRFMTLVDRNDITKDKPHKPLTKGRRQKAGRNNLGRVTMGQRGRGHRRLYRDVDFKRNKDGVPGKVESIEYDPNRSARIALIIYKDGERRYILATESMKVGDDIASGLSNVEVEPGNSMPLSMIPDGARIHNIELKPGRGGQLVRAAGTAATLMSKEGDYAHVRLPSGEMRLVLLKCRATIGGLSNAEHSLESWGKAGRTRWKGKRPKVRGMAMNPCDHPHGGGEGRSKGGNHPVSRTGVPAKGYKTRSKKKYSDKMIMHRRK